MTLLYDTKFEGLSDLGLLSLPINSPKWNDFSTEEILEKIASKRTETYGQTWR